MIDLKNKNIAILGLGDENIALAEYLLTKNIKLTICDEKRAEDLGEAYGRYKDNHNVDFILGDKYLDNLEKYDIIFRTPGLPYLNEKIQKAKDKGVKISSEIELFFANCPCPIIGVTGTKGKGTTTSLIGEILKKKSEIINQKPASPAGGSETNSKSQILDHNTNIYLGGNIGTPPIQFLDKLTKDDIVVLELSSFQLQGLEYSPYIAVVLDIKIDHLDYHKDEAEYIESKKNIVRFQTNKDFAIINADYLTSFEFATETKGQIYWFSRKKSIDQGAWISNSQIYLRIKNKDIPICKIDEVTLRGGHNLENICAAITASFLAGASCESISEVVKSFKGLEHRLEFIRETNGVSYYNDSFSTTPDTSIAAIRSFTEPIILLVGGSEKNANYEELGKVISQSSVKAVISIGKTAARIIENINNQNIEIIKETKTMDEALGLAKNFSKKGDIILLSPASASFDNYKNYKDRGNQFKNEVLNI